MLIDILEELLIYAPQMKKARLGVSRSYLIQKSNSVIVAT